MVKFQKFENSFSVVCKKSYGNNKFEKNITSGLRCNLDKYVTSLHVFQEGSLSVLNDTPNSLFSPSFAVFMKAHTFAELNNMLQNTKLGKSSRCAATDIFVEFQEMPGNGKPHYHLFDWWDINLKFQDPTDLSLIVINLGLKVELVH